MEAVYKVLQDKITLKGKEPLVIWFFGDIHRDTPNCDVDRWKMWLKRAKDSMTDNTYFIGMGDYHDFASTREKKHLSKELHESTQNLFDLVAQQHNRELAKELSFMRGRVLGLIEGNLHGGSLTASHQPKILQKDWIQRIWVGYVITP